jgi:hypothetical protein
MSKSPYKDQIQGNQRFIRLYEEDYTSRLAFARDNGCNTIILTGDGEPLQNFPFLRDFSHWNMALGDRRFHWIELQTTGVLLNDEKLRFLRDTVRVSTISVSVCNIWHSPSNADIIGMPKNARVEIPNLCSEIKRYDFNLRLSINLIDYYDTLIHRPGDIFHRARELGADQIIFRVLYSSGTTRKEFNDQDTWIADHRASKEAVQSIEDYIKTHGKPLERLPFGAIRYSVDGLSTVLDDNCMPQEVTSSFRYLVLRENCKLYSRWDDPASLIF